MTSESQQYLSDLYNEVQQAWKIWPHDDAWKNNLHKALQEIETAEKESDKYLKMIHEHIRHKINTNQ